MKDRRGRGLFLTSVSCAAFVLVLGLQIGCDLQSVTGDSLAASEMARILPAFQGYSNFSVDVDHDEAEVFVIVTPAE